MLVLIFLIYFNDLDHMCPILSLLMTSKLRDLKTEETIFFLPLFNLGD